MTTDDWNEMSILSSPFVSDETFKFDQSLLLVAYLTNLSSL